MITVNLPWNLMVWVEWVDGSTEHSAAKHFKHSIVVHVAQRIFVHLNQTSQILNRFWLINRHFFTVWQEEKSTIDSIENSVFVVVQMVQISLIIFVQIHHVVIWSWGEIDAVVEGQWWVVAGVNWFPVIYFGNFIKTVRKAFKIVTC